MYACVCYDSLPNIGRSVSVSTHRKSGNKLAGLVDRYLPRKLHLSCESCSACAYMCVIVAVSMSNVHVCSHVMTVYLTCSGDEDVFGDASHGKARTKYGPSTDQAQMLRRNGRTLICLLDCRHLGTAE